jgi:tetratricopeptide (TPR) repeat protein
MVYWNRGEFAGSFDEYETARRLITDPAKAIRDIADLDADMAEALIYYGEPNGAIALIQSAMVRNPNFAYWYLWILARAYYMAERYQDAINAVKLISNRIDAPPNDLRLITAASEAQLQNPAAVETMAEFSSEDPDWSIAKAEEYHYGSESARQHWIDGLRKAKLKEN